MEPQSIPAGLDVARPEPPPVNATESSADPVGGGDPASNRAVTETSPETGIEQSALPLHAPSQPEKRCPVPGEARSVIVVPRSNEALHAPGQSIPSGVERTRPWPLTVTVRVALVGPTLPLPRSPAQAGRRRTTPTNALTNPRMSALAPGDQAPRSWGCCRLAATQAQWHQVA
jgi:hypothetical protein